MVRIKLNAFFILFLFASFYTGYIVQSITIFASVLLHEIGHAVVAKALRIKVEEIELFPFGGIAKMEDVTKYGGFTEAWIALGGPAVSGSIAAAATVFAERGEVFESIAQFNFILFAFNILPALPMDGGRILRNMLVHHMSYKRATKTMVVSGRLIAIALVLYNITEITSRSNTVAYIITAVFIYMGCYREVKYSSYYYLLHRNNYKKARAGKPRVRTRIVKVHQDTLVRLAANQFSPGIVCIIHVLDESGHVVRVLKEADVMDALIKHGYDCTISDIITLHNNKLA